MILSGSGLFVIFVNVMWKRYVRLKALEPRLDLEWVDDCAEHANASFKGSKVSLKNVRDFPGKISENTIRNGLTQKLTLMR